MELDRARGTYVTLLTGGLAASVLLAPAAASGQERPGACDSPACCRAAEGAKLTGRVLGGESGAPLPGATVEFLVASPPAEGEEVRTGVETDGTGTYRLCGLPTPARVEARAEKFGATSRSVSFQLDASRRVELNFEIKGVPTGLDSLQEAAAASRADAEPGRVVGRIIDAGTGRPVTEATVELEPEGLTALTDDRGRFAIPEAPAGQGDLTIHHVAYGDQTVEVDVPSELTLNLDIELPPKAIEVEPIDVRVEATIRSRHLERRGFYERMERGFGHFWSPEDLERRNPLRISHVLQQTPGVKLARDCSSGRCVSIPYMSTSAPRATGSFNRSSGGGARDVTTVTDNRGFAVCAAQIYLDGVKLPGSATDAIVNVQDLAAIEVYRGAAGMAPEFIDSDAACGVIALWTKRGPGPPEGGQR